MGVVHFASKGTQEEMKCRQEYINARRRALKLPLALKLPFSQLSSFGYHLSVMATIRSTSPSIATSVPLLHNGDHLSQEEFERRYQAMPASTKAELIEGVVYMAAAVRYGFHADPHASLIAVLVYYAARTPGLPRVADNSTVRLTRGNEVQPDASLLLPAHAGGHTVIDPDDYIAGPPALVCEIAASSVSIDLHLKKNLYLKAGVQEYFVWRTEDDVVDWFSFKKGEYQPIAPDKDGILKSRVFPGLWLSPEFLFAGNTLALFDLIDSAVETAEHAQFVRRLAQA